MHIADAFHDVGEFRGLQTIMIFDADLDLVLLQGCEMIVYNAHDVCRRRPAFTQVCREPQYRCAGFGREGDITVEVLVRESGGPYFQSDAMRLTGPHERVESFCA